MMVMDMKCGLNLIKELHKSENVIIDNTVKSALDLMDILNKELEE